MEPMRTPCTLRSGTPPICALILLRVPSFIIPSLLQTKDKKTNRGIFVTKSEIKWKMKKSDFQAPKRLESRSKAIAHLSHEDRLNVHMDPITALNTLDMFHTLGKYWLRYVCLFLPTLDKFIVPRVCKTFHLFVTLEIGTEDTPDPPPFDVKQYDELRAIQVFVEDVVATKDHSRISNSITDQPELLDMGSLHDGDDGHGGSLSVYFHIAI